MLRSLLCACLCWPWLVLGDQELLVVSEPWPPYVTENAERPGFDVEVSRAVLAEMGYRLRLELMPWRRALVNVQNGQADALLDAFDSPARRLELHYPGEPLSTSTSSLFCYQCSGPAPSVEELAGSRVAINRGYQYSETFDTGTGFLRVPVDTFAQGFRLLERGRVDYYAVNERVGAYMLDQLGLTGYRLVHPPIAPVEPVYLVFSDQAGHAELARRFGERLAAFKQTPAYQAILERYGQGQ